MWNSLKNIAQQVKNLITPQKPLISPLAKSQVSPQQSAFQQAQMDARNLVSSGAGQVYYGATPAVGGGYSPLVNTQQYTQYAGSTPKTSAVTTPSGSTGSGGGSNNVFANPQNPPQQFTWPEIPTAAGSSNDEDAAINAMYAGVAAQLNAQEQSLRSQLPETLSQLNTQGEEMKQPYTEKLQTGQAQLAQNETATRTAEQNAMQQARQLFNELSQYNISRFGGGSSAGPAAMELLSRSTQQQFGNVTQNASENMQKIMDAGRSLTDFVTTSKASIDKQVKDKVSQAQQWFNDQLNQVNANRVMAESDKAAKRYEALTTRQTFINNLQTTAYNYKAQLASWYQQTAATLQTQAKDYTVPNVTTDQLVSQAAQGIAATPRAGTSNTPTVGAASGGYIPSAILGKYVRYGNQWLDQYGNIVPDAEVQKSTTEKQLYNNMIGTG